MADKETARYADIFAGLGSESRLEIMRLTILSANLMYGGQCPPYNLVFLGATPTKCFNG